MPDAKLADPERAALSARALRMYAIDHLLVGDGACVFGNAHAVIGAMLDARDGVFVNRVNLFDESTYAKSRTIPRRSPELGRSRAADRRREARLRCDPVVAKARSSARTTGTRARKSCSSCMRGTPTLRTPRGTFALRAGDCVAFSTNARGAHALSNDADEEALVLLVANADPGDACFYPDSRKFVVEATGTLVRDNPQLDYFDGETP